MTPAAKPGASPRAASSATASAKATKAKTSATAKASTDALEHLTEQRDFLLRSLADLDREHEAGDLDDLDYEQLRDDYTARAAATIRAIEQHEQVDATVDRPSSRRRTLLVVGLVGLFAVVAGIAVAASAGARKPGETPSGGVTVQETASQKANACIPKIQTEPPASSIACFKKVLDKDPRNAVALTWLAWDLSLTAGNSEGGAILQNSASDLLARAVQADPAYSPARAFRAVVAYRMGDADAAERYLADFESHDPSADARAVIDQMDLEAKIAVLRKTSAATSTSSTTAPGTPPPSTTTTPG